MCEQSCCAAGPIWRRWEQVGTGALFLISVVPNLTTNQPTRDRKAPGLSFLIQSPKHVVWEPAYYCILKIFVDTLTTHRVLMDKTGIFYLNQDLRVSMSLSWYEHKHIRHSYQSPIEVECHIMAFGITKQSLRDPSLKIVSVVFSLSGSPTCQSASDPNQQTSCSPDWDFAVDHQSYFSLCTTKSTDKQHSSWKRTFYKTTTTDVEFGEKSAL